MNFGLLCDDPLIEPLVRALQQHPVHRLAVAVLVSPHVDPLLHGVQGMNCTERWEDLVIGGEVDAVIVGGTSPQVWDGARQLASEKIPLLVLPRSADGGALLYELSLIRDDRQGVLAPAWLHRHDAAVLALKEQLQTSGQTSVRYVQWDRVLPQGAGATISNSVIDDELLRDVDLFRELYPAADQVTTLRTGGTESGALIQSVSLAGRNIPALAWTLQSGTAPLSRLTIETEQGPLTLTRESQGWKLRADHGEVMGHDDESARRLLDDFAAGVSADVTGTAWSRVLHAAEVVDAAGRSLNRRRTIELHHETLSERAIFK